MPRVVKPWEYSQYRASLKRNGKFFALVTPDGGNGLAHRDELALMTALRSEATLKSVFEELSKRTGKTVNARNWKKALKAPAAGPEALCLCGPDGRLYLSHLSTERHVEADILFHAFETIATAQGDGWRERFWKKGEATVRAAKKAGWKAVKVRITKE